MAEYSGMSLIAWNIECIYDFQIEQQNLKYC